MTKTISISSGKGGVGKSTLTANLAFALAKRGHKVLILDGDLGMSNIDILFGQKASFTVMDILSEKKTIQEVIFPVAQNIDLISSGSGVVELNRLDWFSRKCLVDAVRNLENHYDYLLIDTSPGISDNVLYLNSAAQSTALVLNPDPSSLTDSYALIKVMNREFKENRFSIICNQVRDEADALALFQRFNEVVSRFLYVGLDYWGYVQSDPLFKKATLNQRLILKHEPNSEPACQISQIAMRMEKAVESIEKKGGLQIFWEQVVGVA